MNRKIVIGSDRGGFELKEHVKKYLTDQGYEVNDAATLSLDAIVPYYETAARVAREVQSGAYSCGILCCGTGMGVSQIANKFRGIFAACCESVYAAKYARINNGSNILCMGGNIVTKAMAQEMIDVFLSTELADCGDPERAEFIRNLNREVKEFEMEIS